MKLMKFLLPCMLAMLFLQLHAQEDKTGFQNTIKVEANDTTMLHGGNSYLILNIPPNREGRFSDREMKS